MAPPSYPDVRLFMKEEIRQKIKAAIDPLLLTDSHVKQVMETLAREMRLGLSRDPEQRKLTSLQMENTYVRYLLDGTERGDYLALDLGGTNFRVLLVRLANGKCESISKNYNVPTSKLHGPASEVFDHLAESIYKFMKEENILDKRLPLGFTFSFPMIQEGIKKGILVTWTKSFACPDGVGQDAVKMLEDALARRGDVMVDVTAVLNDTTGTLMAGSYLDKNCQIGLIMGTGCNAAYLESLDNVDKWIGAKTLPNQVVIDTEWGAFGDNGSLDFIKTKYDKIIDSHSNHKGSFTFEKLFAGHYVGDLARSVLLDLAESGLIFGGHVTDKLKEWKSVSASHVSSVEKDTDDDVSNTNKLLDELHLKPYISDDDRAVVRYLCSVLSIRAAQLVSASISVLLNHMKKPVMTVAIDGSLYKHHPKLHDMMMAWCAELAPKTKTEFILAEDGSGRGAAFVAAVAAKSVNDVVC